MITGRAAAIADLARRRSEIVRKNQLAAAVRIIVKSQVPVALLVVKKGASK